MISTLDYFEKIFRLYKPDVPKEYQVYKADADDLKNPDMIIYAAIFDKPFYEDNAQQLSESISLTISKKWVLANISKVVSI